MKTGSKRLLNVGVAVTVAGALLVAASAPISAHPAKRVSAASLPLLRLNYLGSNKGKLSKTLDPAQVTCAQCADIIALTNANLVHIGTDNKVHPDLATWKVSKNHKVYTFTINKKARFSNGHSVTAADAVFSIKRALAKDTSSAYATTYMGEIKGALDYNSGKATNISGLKLLNRYQLSITINRPIVYFLLTLSYPTADVLDRTVVGGKTAAPTNNFLTNTCKGNQGAGPFKFVCQNGTSDLTSFYPGGSTPKYSFVPNKYFYGAKPHIRIEVPAGDTTDTTYKTYKAGGIDVAGIPAADLPKERKSSQYHEYPTSIVEYITPNSHLAPFDNVHCRLAVSYGIDKVTIAKDIFQGSVKPLYTVVPPGFLGYYNGKSSPHFNLKKAQSEFAQCPGKSSAVQITYPTGSSTADNQYAAIQSMLTTVGFKIKLKAITLNDWYGVVADSLDKSSTQIVDNGWQQDYPDPQDYVELLLASGQIYDVGGFKNAKFDSLVTKADTEANAKKRAALYVQAQTIAIGQGVWIPLNYATFPVLVKPNVHGLVGVVAYGDIVPVGYDWSKVTVGK